jgi:hypothetical protein
MATAMKSNLVFIYHIFPTKTIFFEYSYFSPLLRENLNNWAYPLEVTISRGMVRQTLMHISQLVEGSYLFHIYHNYYNLSFSHRRERKKNGWYIPNWKKFIIGNY